MARSLTRDEPLSVHGAYYLTDELTDDGQARIYEWREGDPNRHQ